MKRFLLSFSILMITFGAQAQTDAINIIPSGNVGIGSTAPAQKLDIQGNLKLDDNMMVEGSSTYRVFRNLASYSAGSGAAGAFVINTNIPWNSAFMFRVKVEGYFYDATSPFETTIGAYMYTGNDFYNYGYVNVGANNLSVRLCRNASSNKVAIILGAEGSSYSYPKLTITSFMQGHSTPVEAHADGWAISQITSLSGYDYVVSVPNVTTLPTGSNNYIQNQVAADQAAGFRINGNGLFNGGNVGIGTLSPAQKLQVNGNVDVSGLSNYYSVNNRSDLGLFGDGNYSLSLNAPEGISINIDANGNNTSTPFSIRENATGPAGGNALMTVLENGNTGIGTAAPTHKLHVNSTAGEEGILINAVTYPEVMFQNGGTTRGYVGIAGSAGGYGTGTLANSLILRSEAAAVHMITNAGTVALTANAANVGIGTTSPAHKLDVIGNVNADHLLNGPLVARPKATWSVAGASTGAVIIKLPGTTANYGMLHMEVDVYEYGSTAATTYILGGHNWSSAWYNYNCQTIGTSNKKVRLAVIGGQYAIVIGETGSAWSYGHVVLSKITNGGYYSANMDLSGTYTVYQDNAPTFTWITADLNSSTNPAIATNYIQNQFTSAQSANYWISGDARIQGNTYIGSNANKYFYPAGDRINVFAESTSDVAEFASYGLYLPKTNAYNLYIGGGAQLAYGTAGYIDFKNEGGISTNSGTLNMYFKNSGYVGVGTTGPAAKFHVSGGGQIIGTNGTTSNTRTLTLLEDGDAQTNFGTYPGAWTSALQIQDNTTNRFIWMSPLDNASGNNSRIMTAATGLDIYTNGSASSAGTLGLTVTAAGSVGVGTATPAFKLQVPSGYIGTDYINTTDNVVGSGVSGIMVKAGDNYHRTGNAAAVLTYLGVTAPTGDNLGNHTATTTLNMNWNHINNVADIYAINNYGQGLMGVYSSTVYQNVFAMSNSYRLPANGSTPGNLYGIAWTHTNVGGQSKSGLGHQALFMENGVTQTAIGNGIWTRATSWIPFIYDLDNTGYYLDANSTSRQSTVIADESYSYGWFRNYNTNQGLYNQATGRHFYSESGSYWTCASGNGMIFRDSHAGSITGYTYSSGGSFGTLSPSGNWRFRCDNSNSEAYGSGFYAPTSYIGFIYDRDNTGYYMDPNSTSRMYYGDYNYLHTQTNDSWFPYTGNNWNYFRGNSYITNAHWYDENNSGYYFNVDNTNRIATIYHGIGSYSVSGWLSGIMQTENTSDGHQYIPLTGNWGYVGTSGQYWYYSYAMSHVNMSQRKLKRDITPLNKSMYDYVMNDIDKIKPTFYKGKDETDELEKGNEAKYRPNMHLGVILDEAPDYIQDQAFSGIDIYAMATLGVAGVKYNREEIKQIKEAIGLTTTKMTINDFGNEQMSGYETWVSFSDEFIEKAGSSVTPVVTVTPNQTGVNLSVIETSVKGFKVATKEKTHAITFNWIAMAKVDVNAKVETESIAPSLLSQLKVDESRKAPIKQFWENQKNNNQAEHARQAEEHKRVVEIGKSNYMETVNPESKKPAITDYIHIPEDAPTKAGNLGEANPSKEGAPKVQDLRPTPTNPIATEPPPADPAPGATNTNEALPK